MTQRAGTPPDGGAARLLIGIPLGTLIALAIASMIGWLILGLPVAAYDPLRMPQFVWYYRGDPRVVRAMAGGLVGGGLLLGGLIYALWARRVPLHGAARFARESEIKRHGFRGASGIVLGRKGRCQRRYKMGPATGLKMGHSV
jgi:type IV secretion system protein VirD4